MVGTYVVTRRMVIVGGGMAHASLGGVGIGAYFGFSPLAGAAGFALLSGLGIEVLTRQRRVREDSAIALLWTLGMSVGILFAYLTPGFMTDLPSYLFGDVLSITKADMLMTGALTLGTALFFICCLPVIVAIAYDRDCHHTRLTRADFRNGHDNTHRTDHRQLPAHGGHCHGHISPLNTANDSGAVCQDIPRYDFPLSILRIPRLPGRTDTFILCQRTRRSKHYPCFYRPLFFQPDNKNVFRRLFIK